MDGRIGKRPPAHGAARRGVPSFYILFHWRCERQAERLIAEGPLMPSIQHRGGTDLGLWRWHDAREAGDGARLAPLDPEAARAGG